ncbi:MAG: hypothetical protein LBU65_13380, partial [Planctomycetaceae bacterium]|nr:hypothetical protein [Planctomycetaceae bacterium]
MRHANGKVYKKAAHLIELLLESGASDAFFVGGTVRDQLLGIDVKGVKDVDIEVYGLSYEQIVTILKPRFRVNFVGKSFGVIKIDNSIDVGVPRRESKHGSGHRGFEVVPDPTMTIREAFARRDFTINAIGLRLNGEFIDPFGGRDDLNNGILRATTDSFCEDPLRVLRGMQFAARFGFRMDSKTIDLCKRVANEFDTLAPERIWDE